MRVGGPETAAAAATAAARALSSTRDGNMAHAEGGGGDGADGDVVVDGDDDEITLIFTPGHTRAYVVLFFAPSKALFSGTMEAGLSVGPDVKRS